MCGAREHLRDAHPVLSPGLFEGRGGQGLLASGVAVEIDADAAGVHRHGDSRRPRMDAEREPSDVRFDALTEPDACA